jgi:hypothetical protein
MRAGGRAGCPGMAMTSGRTEQEAKVSGDGGPGGLRARWPLVACPKCHAPAGELCRAMNIPPYRGARRHRAGPHPGRVALARRDGDDIRAYG